MSWVSRTVMSNYLQSHGQTSYSPRGRKESDTTERLHFHFYFRQHIKKQRHYFANIGPSSQSYDFSSSHAQVWELDHKKGWTPKNWCPQTVVLEKTLESLLDSKEIQPVHSRGNQPWIFIGSTDAEAEAPILWKPDAKNWLLWKKKKPWCWQWLKTGEGGDRGWDTWMALLTQWTCIWEKSGR